MEHTSDIPFVLTPPNIWKGGNKSNGQLMRLPDFYLETGYSHLVIGAALQAELTAAGLDGVPFGNAVFYDRNLRTTEPNKIYAGIPTAVGAKPRLAGVLKYDSALASMQPVNSRGVLAYNKGAIIKRGFLRYKSGKNGALNAILGYSDIDDYTMKFFIELATGDPVFAAPTSYGTSAVTGLTAGEAAALSTALQAAVTGATPNLAADDTVAKLVGHLDRITLTVPGLAQATADKVGLLLETGAMTLTGAVPTLAGCIYAGEIVNYYPEDQSVLVELRI
jgi:hypothetical protein